MIFKHDTKNVTHGQKIIVTREKREIALENLLFHSASANVRRIIAEIRG